MRVLLVKMSSLGDVVHCLPALTDAAAHGHRFDWVVEEAFAPVARRHPACARVIPIAWRRWRRSLWRERRALRAFVTELRAERYDRVLDAQGLLKSAAVTALARAPVKAGLSARSAREGAAALFYDRRIDVPRGIHAIDRLRQLFAAALDYPVPDPDAALQYGIASGGPDDGSAGGRRECMLLHGTTWESKFWPLPFWRELVRLVRAAGLHPLLPWGDADEQARAQEIAAGTGAEVLPRLSLDALQARLANAALTIGVDSGLAHLSAALQVPTLVIYGSTSSVLTGCRGQRVRNLDAEFPCSPCLARQCAYQGPDQHWRDRAVVPACYTTVPPERVWRAAATMLGG